MDEEGEKKGGRPTKYDPKFIGEVELYLKDSNDVWDEFHKTRGVQSDTYERYITVDLPSRDKFAKRIGVTSETIGEWCKIYDEFSEAVSLIDTEQKIRLMDNGLSGNYNSGIAKFILSANHGMKEKTESDVNVAGSLTSAINEADNE